jgi:hypothetical protein
MNDGEEDHDSIGNRKHPDEEACQGGADGTYDR